jgi:uncharacterized membrane protein YeaQ/YmgE (transglycosylase-associated protein family)
MPILAIIIIGAAAGFIATRMMKVQTDMVSTIGIGVLGALAGGLVLIWLWRTYGPRK